MHAVAIVVNPEVEQPATQATVLLTHLVQTYERMTYPVEHKVDTGLTQVEVPGKQETHYPLNNTNPVKHEDATVADVVHVAALVGH